MMADAYSELYGEDPQLSARCPLCEREEEVGNGITGRAWLIGHLQAEHEDELPPFAGTDSDGGGRQ